MSKTGEISHKPSALKKGIVLLMLLIFFIALAFGSKLAGEWVFDKMVKSQQKTIATDKSFK